MTLFDMRYVLRSINVKRKGNTLMICGRAIVNGGVTSFMVTRNIPAEQPPNLSSYWFEELNRFNAKGGIR